MAKIIFFIIVTIFLCNAVQNCQAKKTDSDSNSQEKRLNTILKKSIKQSNVGREIDARRKRRQGNDPNLDLDTASTVLSILPLDRIGVLVGQIMSTGLKEMFNPDVGKKILNVLENQAPSLLTSLFTNLYTTLSVPGKTPSKPNSGISSVSLNSSSIKQLSNSSGSLSNILDSIQRPTKK